MPDTGAESVWRERVRIAEEKLSVASENRRKLQAQSNEQPSPDGAKALVQALQDEKKAHSEYLSALQTLTEILSRRGAPGDEAEADY